MRNAVVAAAEGVCIREVPVPDLEPGTVRIRTAVSLVSQGTEGDQLRGVEEGRGKDAVMGYVSAGVVEEVGPGVETLKAGDRVAGTKWDAAQHATEAVVPQHTFAPIPDDMDFEDAVFAGLAGTGMHAARRTQVEGGHYCLVAGAGLIGQFCSQFARIFGGHVMVSDTMPGRLEIARECGAEAVVDISNEDLAGAAAKFTGGRGIERGIIAVGGDLTKAFMSVLDCMTKAPDGKRCGRIGFPGLGKLSLPSANRIGNVDIAACSTCGAGYRDADWERHRLYTPGYVEWQLDRNLREIIGWIRDGSFRTRPLITHRMHYTEAPRAWELIRTTPDRVMGVLLSYD